MTKENTPVELLDAELDDANGGIIAILIGKDGNKSGQKKTGNVLTSMEEGETCTI